MLVRAWTAQIVQTLLILAEEVLLVFQVEPSTIDKESENFSQSEQPDADGVVFRQNRPIPPLPVRQRSSPPFRLPLTGSGFLPDIEMMRYVLDKSSTLGIFPEMARNPIYYSFLPAVPHLPTQPDQLRPVLLLAEQPRRLMTIVRPTYRKSNSSCQREPAERHVREQTPSGTAIQSRLLPWILRIRYPG